MKQGPPGRLNSLKWAKRVRTSDLHPLPGRIYDRIIRHAMKSTDEIILDLDHQRAEGLALNLLGVNRGRRQTMRADYADSNRIVVRLRTDEATSTFSDWEHLRSWRGGTLSCIFPTNIDAPTRKDRELVSTIDLNFNIAPPATLADVRVGVIEFIRLTYGLRPHSLLRFILHGKGLQKEVHVTTLESLRKAIFVFLSIIVDQDPDSASLECPEVWIDGHGNIIEAIYAATDKHAERSWPTQCRFLAPEEILSMGTAYAGSLVARPRRTLFLPCREHNLALTESNSLRAIWISLRDLDWFHQATWGAWSPMSSSSD
jgi:hypothetical protein